MVALLLYSYFRRLCAFLWFRHRQKCLLRFVMGRAGATIRRTRRLARVLSLRGRQKGPKIELRGSGSDEHAPSKSEWTWWMWIEHTFTQFMRRYWCYTLFQVRCRRIILINFNFICTIDKLCRNLVKILFIYLINFSCVKQTSFFP